MKLVSATPSQVLSLITGPERCALQSQLSELAKEEESERCFIEAALQDLKVSGMIGKILLKASGEDFLRLGKWS